MATTQAEGPTQAAKRDSFVGAGIGSSNDADHKSILDLRALGTVCTWAARRLVIRMRCAPGSRWPVARHSASQRKARKSMRNW